jgi:ATP-binding cassette, subfamily B, multidrug efflux pump
VLVDLLRTYLRPYRRWLAAVVVFQLAGTLAALYPPSLNANIIDHGIAQGDTGYIVRTGGWMLAVTAVQGVGIVAAVYCGARAAMAFGRDVRAAIFTTVGRFSTREITQFGAPSLITRNTNDVQQVQMLVVVSATMLVMAPIMSIGGVVMALQQDVGLSWLMLVAVPALLAGMLLIVREMIPAFRAMQVRIDAVNRVLREQITGIRVVRAFVREPYEAARFDGANTALTEVALRVGRLMALVFPFIMIVLNVSSAAVLWFGGQRVDAGAVQVGALTAFLTYLMHILMAVMMVTFLLVMVPRAAVSAERISEVLRTRSSVVPPTDPVREMPSPGVVELRGAGFAYPRAEAPVLSGITFSTGPGQRTAVIGSTGAGKTTLLNLIPRLMDVTSGAVLVGGVDVRDLDPDLLRGAIGMVPQKAFLFSGTVASNLRYGRPDATDEELWTALEVAQARDFVAALPERLDAPVAQGGVNFSGGQRQRLAIARALVKRPAVYLFDDSFSALDVGTDARLRVALRSWAADAALIIVAQRVATIRDADQIVVLDDGVVVGIGRHDELVETCPTYAEIVASQLTAEEAAR